MKNKKSGLFIVTAVIFFALLFISMKFFLKTEKVEKKYISPNTALVYNWLINNQLENGLLETSENSNLVSLYDNALAVMAFSIMGDFDKAEKTLDYFADNIAEVKTAPGGFGQFRKKTGKLPAEGSRRWMGDNAWLLLAINNYHSLAKNNKYHILAQELEAWLRSLQDKDGGLIGGFEHDGRPITKVTEGMIDALNAVEGYDSFHSSLLAYLKTERWDAADGLLISWPDPPHPNYKYALDLVTWGYCSLQDFPVSVLKEADRFLNSKTSTVNQAVIEGYCMDEDNDTVWFEGTGQMAVAFNTAGLFSEANKYLSEMERGILISNNYKNSVGFPYTTNLGTSYGDGELWTGADENICVSSNVWYLFGVKRFNPFDISRNKPIPEQDKFWSNNN
jgi:hypothetical protein